jgi:hypothetical protein
MPYTIKKLIKAYVELRLKKSQLKDKHKLELEPISDMMNKLEAVFMGHMDKDESDSVSVRGVGTIYRATRSNVTVTDFDAFKDYIVEHDAWELLQARASVPAVEVHMEDTGNLPPGVSITRFLKIFVRKD